jgi:two-component system cell cycle sensor histidine kinase/response regulator CckA
MTFEQGSVCSLVARTLVEADAARCLDDALAVCAAHGLVSIEPEDADAGSLSFECKGRTLHLHARGAVPDADTRELLGALLRAAAQRSCEHEEKERIRERMEMLSAASFEGMLIHEAGLIIDVNQRFLELFGYTKNEVLGKPAVQGFVAFEDQARTQERVSQRVEGSYILTALRKDGSRFLAEVQTKQARLGARPVRVAALQDVTERERRSELLRESEQRLRHLVEAHFDFVTLAREGVFIDAGGNMEAVLGIKPAELVGRSILSVIAPEELERWTSVVQENRMGVFETMVVAASGEKVPVEIVAVRSSLDGEPVRLTGVRDLRQARRLERERQEMKLRVERGQRLEGLGLLAGGIAHDFNNLLIGVLGNAELLCARLTRPQDLACCEAILVAGERAASLTKQLLTYAGKSAPLEREPVDLHVLWRELRSALDATLSKQARLELDLEPGCLVMGERAALTQVFLNFLTNASDALAQRPGVIEVSMHRLSELDPTWQDALRDSAPRGASAAPAGAPRTLSEADGWILVQVSDTGSGMDEATTARMFEPFFSTKARGHGLGLAACLGIVSAHGGAIRVHSELGVGTRIGLLLPALSARTESRASPSLTSEPTPCKILVVDDDPLVRASIRYALEPRGFVLAEATDGESALSCYRQSDADLLIVDFTMPGIDGGELVRRLRAAGLRAPIILSSGHLESAVLQGLSGSAIQATLRKPYGPKVLLEAIARAQASARE